MHNVPTINKYGIPNHIRNMFLGFEDAFEMLDTFTSKSEQLHLLREQFFSIDLSLDNSSSDYDRLVSEQNTDQ